MLSDAFILSLMKLSEDVYIEKLSAIESTIENADHDTQQLWHDFRYKILERGYAAYHLTRTAERNAKSNPSHNCLDFTNGYTDITETEATELLTQFFTAEGKLNQDLLHILKLEYNLATNLCL